MPDTPLAKKLLIKPGQRIAVINPPPGYLDQLGPLPEGVQLADRPEGQCDLVHLFVGDLQELARVAPTALAAVKPDGVFWVSYPKQSSKVKTDINRDTAWQAMSKLGLRPVTQISIDEVWSALRFRPTEAVGKGKKEG